MSQIPVFKPINPPLTGAEKVALVEAFLRKYGPLGGIATPPEDIIRQERDARSARLGHG